MTFIEFLGFVISLVAMFFLVAKRFWEETRRRRNPVQFAEEQRKKDLLLSEFMKSFEIPEKGRAQRNSDDEDEWDEDEEDIEVVEKIKLVQPPPKTFPPLKPSIPLNRGSMRDSYQEEIVSSQFLKREASAYDVVKQQTPSRGSMIVRNLPSKKNMLVIKEIFGPPKSMQDHPWD